MSSIDRNPLSSGMGRFDPLKFLEEKAFNNNVRDSLRVDALMRLSIKNANHAFHVALDLLGDKSSLVRRSSASIAKIVISKFKGDDHNNAVLSLKGLLGNSNSFIRMNAVDLLSFTLRDGIPDFIRDLYEKEDNHFVRRNIEIRFFNRSKKERSASV